jgi:formamidopyrimidine-DNA glycosylase
VELPEVEVMRRDLEKDVVGLRIKEAEVKSSKNAMRVIRRHKTRKDFTSRLVGHKVTRSSAAASTCSWRSTPATCWWCTSA